MEHPSVSVAVVTYNSERHLQECLSSVTWASEIILMDLGSQDRTIEIARSFNCHIHNHEWVPVVELVRQKAIEMCVGDWILALDPDEIVPPSLAKRLQQIASENTFDAVSIPRKNYIFGRWMKYSGWGGDRHIRFFRKGNVDFATQVHSGANTNGRVLELPAEDGNYMIHFNYDDVYQFIEKLNRYTNQEAQILASQNNQDLIANSSRAYFNALRQRYFENEGYKDNLQGFVASELMACYNSVAYAKAIEKLDWLDAEKQHLISDSRRGVLWGMWDLLLGMERTAESRFLRVTYRLVRAVVSFVLRIRAY